MPPKPTTYYFHGKLLLTGEYFVLDGATALAIPTKLGQRFMVRTKPAASEAETVWNIHYPDGSASRQILLYPGDWTTDPQPNEASFKEGLLRLLQAVRRLGIDSRAIVQHKQIDCYLEFPSDWGLGSSSTLVAFASQLFSVDAYALLAGWLGGSGYDLACATARGPLLYRRTESRPEVTPLDWSPAWLQQTYFVHLNRKQNSREGIAAYRARDPEVEDLAAISRISTALLEPTLHLRAAARLLEEHEYLVAHTLKLQPVKERLFPDFPGTVKSLGAWGGDFAWVLSERPAQEVAAYFNSRGYTTFLPYKDLAL
ncbi:hypothetical protein LEM8419_02496 [Neolewinella maritima]|uniref:GHMP kinase n=1 Tax=Neolewinella maritima TaxID=1383882 RepID=A0ABM9B2M6_9BACT|nr:GYDIA family GHMP kinase [Neolewinella maritima]CAH1001592.1 hypothetical protein LEM8419_02496 [Neolewinella maritima]